MKQPLTIRLERQQLVAIKRLAKQRGASLSSVAEDAISGLLDGHDRALPLRSVVDELREQLSVLAERHQAALDEQRDLFAKTQEANVMQVSRVLTHLSDRTQASLQPLLDALNGSSEPAPTGPPRAGALKELVLGQKLRASPASPPTNETR